MARRTTGEGLWIVFQATAIVALVFLGFFWFFRGLEFLWDKCGRRVAQKAGFKVQDKEE